MDNQGSSRIARSVPRFCRDSDISVPLFYKKRKALLKAGRPDPITKVGNRSIVTEESGRAFLAEPAAA
jgi:ABC-type ATPase with predicted acetyltransferase domain